MLKVHTIFIIASLAAGILFLTGGFRINYLPLMRYAEINGNKVWVKLMGKRHTCVPLQQLSNAGIKVKGHNIQLVQNEENATEHLNVFVVLHSHVDPGWLYTFNEYYNVTNHSVKKILNNVVNSLKRHRKLRFIWSEMSFLEKWWSEGNVTNQKYFKSLVDEGRLEITSGQWVMNDEATPYFWETIENIIVGHRYVQSILNITPISSWSVDPFGHGLMMPYLMMLSDIKQMVIGRINSNIKSTLRQHHQLHFRWAQNWDPHLRWAPFVNVLPSGYYTVSSACGKDERICCQFDVSRTSRSYCSERAAVDSAQQIALYGERMANQYRSLQTYYNSEAVLVAAGDDFLYSHPDDLETVYRIYTALFNYINRNYDRFHMKVQFGTVADYFNALNESRKNEATVLAGDFFPYMDDESGRAPFWTGFYNHRPYFKCFERIIQREFRLTDLLSVTTGKYPSDDVEVARRDLALSLHHDAITGTSRRRVMDDYTLRLRSALHILLKEQKRLLRTSNDTFTTIFINDSVKTKGMHLSRKILSFTDAIESYKIRIVNQKAFQTMELIKLNTSTSSVTVMHAGEQLTTQLVPLMRKSNLFELSFFVPLQPFSQTNVIVQLDKSEFNSSVSSKSTSFTRKIFSPKMAQSNETISLKNQFFTLYWNIDNAESYRLIYNDERMETNFSIHFNKIYDYGGAYTMISGLRFRNVSNNEQLSAMIIKGPVYSSIYQQLSPQLSYQITVINSTDNLAQSLQIDVFTNVISMPGNTFFMNLKSSIENDANFYTDINGLYLIDRRYDKRMKLEANIYPMATEAMIEDDNLRCTILTAQTTGVTSKMSGTLQLMIDREVYNDDGKGLEYYEASESYPTHLKYRIIFEPKISMKVNEDERHSGIKIANKHGTENDSLSMNVSNTVIYHSQFVQQTMDALLYPAALFLSSNIGAVDHNDNLSAAPFRLPGLPDNIQLITARFIAYKTVLISMRQLPYDCSVIPYHKSNNNLDLAEFFSSFNNASIYSTNLTGTRIGNQITPELIPSHFTQPFEIISFIVLIN